MVSGAGPAAPFGGLSELGSLLAVIAELHGVHYVIRLDVLTLCDGDASHRLGPSPLLLEQRSQIDLHGREVLAVFDFFSARSGVTKQDDVEFEELFFECARVVGFYVHVDFEGERVRRREGELHKAEVGDLLRTSNRMKLAAETFAPLPFDVEAVHVKVALGRTNHKAPKLESEA